MASWVFIRSMMRKTNGEQTAVKMIHRKVTLTVGQDWQHRQ